MKYHAYKDECYVMGINTSKDGIFDGYVNLSAKEKKEFDRIEKEYFRWQNILQRRYKRK